MAPPPASPPVPAAGVLLAASPGSPEVLVVRRATALRFFGGFLAFPGGKTAASDSDPHPGLSDSAGPDTALRTRRVTAVRELFEETGILLARRPDGSFPPSGPDLAQARRELLAGSVPFAALLERAGLALRETDLEFAGELTTPPFAPVRYATAFFRAHSPPNQAAEVWPGELEEGGWTTAAALLGRWERGECLVTPPTVAILRALRGRAVDEAAAVLAPLLRSLAAGALPAIDYAPGVRLLPLHTAALPPTAYTNAYLVGQDPSYLIDPGADEPGEQARLFEALDGWQGAGARVAAVVLTHHHPDHVGAASACAGYLGAPVWAHRLTAEALRDRLKVDRFLEEGDRLPLGLSADGEPWRLEVLHTPGHARGHLAFWEPHYRLLFAGDLVSTVSSVIIAPPEGDLGLYLESLRRVRTFPSRLLLPGHGSPSAAPEQAIDECLAHRARREEMLLAALGQSPRSVPELALELYKGVAAGMMRFAELQLLAGLQKLHREGRAEPVGPEGAAGWRLRQPP